jgi:hypothetical protein
MAEFLFPEFLRDLQQYEQAESIWQRLWQDLIGRTGQLGLWETPWHSTTFVDGTPCRDGNPIFSAVSATRRLGIRVMQLEPEENPREITYWMDTFAKGESEEVNELVIACVLSDQTLLDAVNLMRQWITREQIQLSWQYGFPTFSSDPVRPRREFPERAAG